MSNAGPLADTVHGVLLNAARVVRSVRVHPLVAAQLDGLAGDLDRLGGKASPVGDLLREMIGAYVLTALARNAATGEILSPAAVAHEHIARVLHDIEDADREHWATIADRLATGDSAHQAAAELLCAQLAAQPIQ